MKWLFLGAAFLILIIVTDSVHGWVLWLLLPAWLAAAAVMVTEAQRH